MRRGDVVWADLDPARSDEADKHRPAIVVSNDGANQMAALQGRGVVTIVPVTANTDRVHPFQVFLSADRCGLRIDSKAQAEQVRSVAAGRLTSASGRIPSDLMAEVDDALRLHLAL